MPFFLTNLLHYQAFIQALLSIAVFASKIQYFYSFLSWLSPWGIPRGDSKGKNYEVQVSRLLENAFPILFLTAVNISWEYLHFVMFANIFFVCSSSNFCWSFMGSFEEKLTRKIQTTLHVCKYLNQIVTRIGE